VLLLLRKCGARETFALLFRSEDERDEDEEGEFFQSSNKKSGGT
jgi:hypothetical protein